jgi:hypothetical protein
MAMPAQTWRSPSASHRLPDAVAALHRFDLNAQRYR